MAMIINFAGIMGYNGPRMYGPGVAFCTSCPPLDDDRTPDDGARAHAQAAAAAVLAAAAVEDDDANANGYCAPAHDAG